ncbi:hypothetical protein A9975_16705 [Cupriavidus sp. UME77]|nr:hypothetical protein [Cupriavidus sp. UME77]
MSEVAEFDPRKTAILAMDWQASILGFLSDPGSVLANVGRAITAVRKMGGKVGYVRVAFEDADYGAFPSHSAMGARIKAAGPNMRADSSQTAVHASIAPQSADIVVRKTRVGAFSTTNLDAQLKLAGVETLVLTGVHSSGVVLTAVREAHDLDYRVIVLSDACADPDEQVHEFLISTIFPRQATVMTVAELVGRLDAA